MNSLQFGNLAQVNNVVKTLVLFGDPKANVGSAGNQLRLWQGSHQFSQVCKAGRRGINIDHTLCLQIGIVARPFAQCFNSQRLQ